MPRFCAFCGGRIARRAPVACPGCGGRHWLNAKPAAAALVVHESRLLLLRRGIEPWRGEWCAPGGFCDGDEHPIAAAEREALEEAGLRVRVTGYLGHWIDEYGPGSDDGVDPEHVAVSYYHARVVGSPELRVDAAEMLEGGWFPPDGLPEPLAPAGNGERIYAAWRDALEAGRLDTPLPDR